jgi:hypothetical protein
MSRTKGARDLKPRKNASEKEILAAVLEHHRALGEPNTFIATIPNEFAHGQLGLTKGLPDLLVLGPSIPSRVGFLELKTLTGKPSPAQEAFQSRCIALGICHAIAYGRDEPIYILETWGVVKASKSNAS